MVTLHEADRQGMSDTYLTYQSILFGVVVWEWLVCLRQEYHHVWKSKPSVIQTLYLLSRYVCLGLTTAVFALNYVHKSLAQCDLLVRFNCAAIVMMQAISLAVLTQRAYYVSMRSKKTLGLLALFILGVVALGIVHAVCAVKASSSELVRGDGRCRVEVRNDWKAFTAIFFALPVLGHAVATAVVMSFSRRNLPNHAPLRRVLLIDGALYLITVDAIGLIQLLFFIVSQHPMMAMMNGAALLSLTSVFCCRFILHLKERSDQVSRPTTESWTERADWTNNFGKPYEESRSQLTSFNSIRSPKLKLSRLQDTGALKIQPKSDLYLPEFMVETEDTETRYLTDVKVERSVWQEIDVPSKAHSLHSV